MPPASSPLLCLRSPPPIPLLFVKALTPAGPSAPQQHPAPKRQSPIVSLPPPQKKNTTTPLLPRHPRHPHGRPTSIRLDRISTRQSSAAPRSAGCGASTSASSRATNLMRAGRTHRTQDPQAGRQDPQAVGQAGQAGSQAGPTTKPQARALEEKHASCAADWRCAPRHGTLARWQWQTVHPRLPKQPLQPSLSGAGRAV